MANKLLDISPSDKSRVQRDEVRHPVVRFLKEKENLQFNIGDILIKKIKRHGSAGWVTEMMSSQSKIPRKYIYLHENEWGIGYIKRLKADGTGTCGPMMCLADVEYSYIRYEVDPEYSDHIILGEVEKYEYNEHFRKEKELRTEIHKYNRSILISTKSIDILNQRIRIMKPGDHFWLNEVGIGISDIQDQEYEVVSVTQLKSTDAKYQQSMGADQWAVLVKPLNPHRLSAYSSGKTLSFVAYEFYCRAFTTTRPKSMKDIHG